MTKKKLETGLWYIYNNKDRQRQQEVVREKKNLHMKNKIIPKNNKRR